jgi:hypothetical protein
MLFSAGECLVCSIAGDALFVQDYLSRRIFFLCPHDGCAWRTPPRLHEVEAVDPPDIFAPEGIALPSRAEIVAQGSEAAIAREMDESEWIESLEHLAHSVSRGHMVHLED